MKPLRPFNLEPNWEEFKSLLLTGTLVGAAASTPKYSLNFSKVSRVMPNWGEERATRQPPPLKNARMPAGE